MYLFYTERSMQQKNERKCQCFISYFIFSFNSTAIYGRPSLDFLPFDFLSFDFLPFDFLPFDFLPFDFSALLFFCLLIFWVLIFCLLIFCVFIFCLMQCSRFK